MMPSTQRDVNAYHCHTELPLEMVALTSVTRVYHMFQGGAAANEESSRVLEPGYRRKKKRNRRRTTRGCVWTTLVSEVLGLP